MSKDIKKAILKALEKADSTISGNLLVSKNKNLIDVAGELTTSLKPKEFDKVVNESVTVIDSKLSVRSRVKFGKPALNVVEVSKDSRSSKNNDETDVVLDEIAVLFTGPVAISLIEENNEFKRVNFETHDKLRLIYETLGFMPPIVLDKNLKVIDGMLRLEVFKKTHKDSENMTIPAVVVDAEGTKATFLRLTLNRLPEFQRWIYSDVDPFVDTHLNLQPLLEPIGFFGNNVLPTTFFGNTIVEYHIDEFNQQMELYSQDQGLADWAAHRKAAILAEEEAKIEKRNKSAVVKTGMRSLFDLSPKKTDVIEVSKPEEVVQAHVDEMKVVAGGVTAVYDEKRKAEKEAKGQDWQNSRRTSKALAKDKRAEAEKARLADEEAERLGEGE